MCKLVEPDRKTVIQFAKKHYVRLANKAANVQVDWHNGDATESQANAAVQKFEDRVKIDGFDTIWPGLYPVLVRDGQQIHFIG